MMKQLFSSSHLFGSNAPFIEELYETYLENPDGVSEEWQQYFDSLQNTPGGAQRDVAHYPVINAFADMAKRGPTRVVHWRVAPTSGRSASCSLSTPIAFSATAGPISIRSSAPSDPRFRSSNRPITGSPRAT